MTMTNDLARLPHRLTRTLRIEARRETVFAFFTDPVRWAAWWGAGSSIDPRPGGHVLIRYPDGTEAVGDVVEIAAPARIVFSYGYAKGTPIQPSGSLVTILLEDEDGATRLDLTHAFAEAGVRDHHVQGWRYQLSLFANAVAGEVHAGAADVVDRWFAAWSEPGDEQRESALRRLVTDDVRMKDQYSAIEGLAELLEHVAASRRFMPGISMHRAGEVRQCQGTAIADWLVQTPEGAQRGAGTNVFEFGGDGRLRSIVGFWRTASHSPS